MYYVQRNNPNFVFISFSHKEYIPHCILSITCSFVVGNFPNSCVTECRCYFNRHQAAIVANCSYSGLTNIPDSLPEQTDWLLLSGNNISSLMTETIPINDKLYYLSKLDLDGNNIANLSSEIVDGFTETNIIEYLVLSNNHLRRLPENIENLTSLKTLQISGNKFECSCKNLWMKEWLQNETGIVDDLKNVKCQMTSGKWIPVVHMDKADMGCVDSSGDTFSVWNILGIILISLYDFIIVSSVDIV